MKTCQAWSTRVDYDISYLELKQRRNIQNMFSSWNTDSACEVKGGAVGAKHLTVGEPNVRHRLEQKAANGR